MEEVDELIKKAQQLEVTLVNSWCEEDVAPGIPVTRVSNGMVGVQI